MFSLLNEVLVRDVLHLSVITSGVPHIRQLVYRVLKCEVIFLQIFPFEPLNLIMRYTRLL